MIGEVVQIHSGDSDVVYRTIPGFPGYAAGSDGMIWSAWYRGGGGVFRGIGSHWRKLNPIVCSDSRGIYKRATIRTGVSQRKLIFVHKLVMLAHVGPCPSGMEICHWDDNGLNNELSNLRYDTPRGNRLDRKRNGRHPSGTRHYATRLSEADIIAMRQRYADGSRVADIARDFSMQMPAIYGIVKGHTFRDCGGPIISPCRCQRCQKASYLYA